MSNERFFEGIEKWDSIAKDRAGSTFVIYAGSSKQVRIRQNLISWQSIKEIEALC